MIEYREPTQREMRVAKAICKAHGIDPEARGLHIEPYASQSRRPSQMPGAVKTKNEGVWSVPNYALRIDEAITQVAAFEQMYNLESLRL